MDAGKCIFFLGTEFLCSEEFLTGISEDGSLEHLSLLDTWKKLE